MGDEAVPDDCGITHVQRIDLSQHGQVCGMKNCDVPPEQLCRPCGFWYCIKDYPHHMRKFPEHAKGVK